VTVSIVSGLGGLDLAQARTLGLRVGLVLVLLWTAAIVSALLVVAMFPAHESASFFSTTMLEDRERFDFLGLYIPTNPFNSLANNVVPAVVLFSLVVGVALISVPQKSRLIEVLHIASAAISKATNFIVSLTPYGVFAIAAVVSGTLGFDTLKRLQVYLVSYIGMALFVSFWLLPGLIAALTPVPFRAVLVRTRNALVLAFMTTSLFAVLPLLTEEVKSLLREYAQADERVESLPDVIVPASFNFPHSGKLLSLSFLPFAAWFSDTTLPLSAYAKLGTTGLVVMFGNVNAAIPFLLDMLRIPGDTFQLFVTSGVVNARFGTLVAAVHTVTVALIGACAVSGRLRIDARKLARFGAVTAALLFATVGGLHALLAYELKTPYDKDQVLANMEAIRNRGPARVFTQGQAAPPLPAVTTTVADRVRGRGIVRVGYFDDSLPYVYTNAKGSLVGFDIEMAQQLGADLNVEVEFVPIDRQSIEKGLDPAECDIVMSGVATKAERLASVRLSTPYLDETLAFIVPDHDAAKYADWETIRTMKGVRFGVPQAPHFLKKVQEMLSNAELVPIGRMDEIFQPHEPPIDAFIATAERGSAYTILHPDFTAVVPRPHPYKVPLAYVIAGRDQELASIVDTWIDMKRKDGTIDELFEHWILGRQPAAAGGRWSIARDVLHWIR
jgi:Na+/H+-dicarboxylate symporter/ABC-type amino acid transport substrate-binding protein